MAEADALQRRLIQAQNPDGGWGYGSPHGSSWTEPTALALLALFAHELTGTSYDRASRWLRQNQRKDGGWPPSPTVTVSTWVTSLAALALPETGGPADQHARAIDWLRRQINPEMDPVQKLVFRFRGVSPPLSPLGGSPWFPGSAAWVAPTVMSVLALSDALRRNNDSCLSTEVRQAQQYILSRRCRDGGWNHGGARYLSENSGSYPEMTGMALLALSGVPDSELSVPLQFAESLLNNPGSIEALSWLQLALIRHGRDVREFGTPLPCRTTRDISLRLLALAGHSATNKFLTAA